MMLHELELEGLLDRELEALPADRRAGRPPAPGPRADAARSWPCCWPTPSAASIPRCWPRRCPTTRRSTPILRAYFPRRIVEATGELYREHRLRREIVATAVTNDIVNSLGIAWVWQMMAETGAEAAEVVRAYWIAREVTGAVARWEEVEALFDDPAVDTDVQMEVMGGVDGLVEGVSRWYLQHAERGRCGGRDRARPRLLQRALADAARHRQRRLARRPRAAARGAGRARRAAAAGRRRGLAAGADLRARRDRRRARDRLLAGRGGARVLRRRRAAPPGLARGSAGRDRRRDALAALGAGRRARRAARDAARAHRAGARGRPRRARRRGRRALPGASARSAVARVERLVASLRADGMADTAAAMVGVRQLRSAFA